MLLTPFLLLSACGEPDLQCGEGTIEVEDECVAEDADADTDTDADADPDCGSAKDHHACYGGDLYWYDACDARGALEETCAQGCIESGDDAACVDVSFRCWDDEHVCLDSLEKIYVYFECEAKNDSDVALTFTNMTVRSADPGDVPSTESVFREEFTGGLNLDANSGWEYIPHDGRFAAALTSELPDEEFEIEADFEVLLDDASQKVYDQDADASKSVEVPDSAFDCID